VHDTPAGTPAPYFKVGDCVLIESKHSTSDGLSGSVAAVAWENESKSYLYKADDIWPYHEDESTVFGEDDLVISDYAVGDVVKVQVFGKTARRIIEKISLGGKGEFIYCTR
jgi:hypothetical protein